MFNATQAAKTRINSLTNSASDSITGVGGDTLAFAADAPSRVHDFLVAVYDEALAALRQYVTSTAHAYSNAYQSYSGTADALAESLATGNPKAALPHLGMAFGHGLSGSIDMYIGNKMAVPIGSAFSAGIKLLSGTVTANAILDLAAPILVIIAVGYASLRIKRLTASKVDDMTESFVDKIDGNMFDDLDDYIEDDLDDDIEDENIVVEEVEDDETPQEAIQRIEEKAEKAVTGGA